MFEEIFNCSLVLGLRMFLVVLITVFAYKQCNG